MDDNNNFSKKFAKIPKEIASLGLEQGDILVLAHIKIHYNSTTKLCNPGTDCLVKESGYSKKFILESVKRLESAGLITVIRQRGKSNQYSFTDKGKKFERFAESFLNIKNLSNNAKEFYMRLQEFLYIHDDGTADTTYNTNQIALLTGISRPSVIKYLSELEDKGYLVTENGSTSTQSGLLNVKHVFLLDALGQQVLYKLKEHDDKLQEHDQRLFDQNKQIVNLQKQVDYLTRQLLAKNTEKVDNVYQFED